MKKIIISLFLLLNLSSSLSASMLLDKTYYCIEDFYVNNGRFYYLRSDNNTWYSTTTKSYASGVFAGYIYESDTGNCVPDKSLMLGMFQEDFHFLMALIGLIFGSTFMFFVIKLSLNVGGKR
jgi:hypothetical protein